MNRESKFYWDKCSGKIRFSTCLIEYWTVHTRTWPSLLDCKHCYSSMWKKKKDFNNLTTNCTTVKHRTIGYLHPAPGSSIPKAMDSLIGTELEATQILYISAIPHNTSFSVPSSPQRLSVQDPFPPNPISWNLNPQLQHIPHFYFKSPYPQSQKSFHQFFTP